MRSQLPKKTQSSLSKVPFETLPKAIILLSLSLAVAIENLACSTPFSHKTTVIQSDFVDVLVPFFNRKNA